MVRHVVLWKLKDEVASDARRLEQTIAQIRKNSETLASSMPLVRGFSFYQSITHGTDIYELGTAMDFDSREDIAEFRASPQHQEPDAMAFCHAVRERKAVIDFEF